MCLLAWVLSVLAWLGTIVLRVLWFAELRAFVLPCFARLFVHVLACLACLACLHACVLTCFACLLASVPCMFVWLIFFTCFSASMLVVLICLIWFIFQYLNSKSFYMEEFWGILTSNEILFTFSCQFKNLNFKSNLKKVSNNKIALQLF